jgi:hypothetical protein
MRKQIGSKKLLNLKDRQGRRREVSTREVSTQLTRRIRKAIVFNNLGGGYARISFSIVPNIAC